MLLIFLCSTNSLGGIYLASDTDAPQAKHVHISFSLLIMVIPYGCLCSCLLDCKRANYPAIIRMERTSQVWSFPAIAGFGHRSSGISENGVDPTVPSDKINEESVFPSKKAPRVGFEPTISGGEQV